MDHLQAFWNAYGQLILAGAAGGIVRWLTLREGWWQGITSVVIGAILAVYIGPHAVWMLSPVITFVGGTPESVMGLGGFIVGVGGIVVSGFLIDLWQIRARLLKNGGAEHGQP
jgi:hypothetical protein